MNSANELRNGMAASDRLEAPGPLTKEHGVWVFHTGQALPASATDEMLQQIREECDLANLGKGE